MSPTLLLLRLLAVLMVPMLVAPTIVSADRDEPAPVVRTAALALSVDDGAAELADPLAAPPALVRPARRAGGRTTVAPAPPADAAQAEAAEPAAATPGEEPARDKAKAKAKAKAPGRLKGTAPTTAQEKPAASKAEASKKKQQPAAAKQKAKKQQQAAKAKAARKQGGKGRAAAAAPNRAPRILYLGVGHGRAANGRWQPGAEHAGKGMFEVGAAQVMVDAMVEVLRDAPNLVVHAESGDHPNVVGSVARANALGVDDCIEVHQDTAAAPPGVFGHWYAGASASHRLANRLVRAVANQGVPVRHDWHRARSGLYWVRESDCRAVLMEVGRVGDFSAKELRAFGRAMARAYLRDTKSARGIG